MARKRKDFSEAELRALMARGGTAASITAKLVAAGVDASKATVGRRMRELRGTTKPRALRTVKKKAPARRGRPPPLPPTEDPPLPPSPDAIPEGVSITQLDRWIGQAEAGINKAEKEGNLPIMGQMLRVAAALAETRRKASPPERPDPNENPDMVSAAARCRDALHKLVESAIEAGA